MKKVVSIILTVLMLVSSFATVSADIHSNTGWVKNPFPLTLQMEVLARNSGTSDEYTSELPLTIMDNDPAGVDYKATLDMGGVRDLFSQDFISSVMPGNEGLRNEFYNGTVNTSINVSITCPAGALVTTADLQRSGVLDAGNIFAEKERTVVVNNDGTRTVNITYINENNLSVSRLMDNTNDLLRDITFTLNDVISYSTQENHRVYITLSGSTEIDFASKKQIVNYSGNASHIVTATHHVEEHILEVVKVIPATCTTDGWTEGVRCATHNSYTCGVAGTVEPDEIPALGHNAPGQPNANTIYVEGHDATCSHEGMYAHYTCLLCKEDLAYVSETEVGGIVAHSSLFISRNDDHVHTHVLNAQDPYCTRSGLTAGVYCDDCHSVVTPQTVTAPLGHNRVSIPGVPATCTTAGKTEGVKCSRCNEILTPQKDIAPLGHSYGDWVITQAPTEDAVGSKTKTCGTCGDTVTVEIPKLAHTHSLDENAAVVVSQPTCTEAGLIQNYCACGEAFGAPVEIPAIGHSMSQVAKIAATCTTEGVVAHYHCANCDKNYADANGKIELASVTEPKNHKNHGDNIVVISGYPATCVSEGLEAGSKCSACNVVIEYGDIIPKSAHNLNDLEYIRAKDSSCTEHGIIEHWHCYVCNLDFDEDLKEIKNFKKPPLGHKFGQLKKNAENHPTGNSEHKDYREPTDSAKGLGWKKCERCTHYKDVEIETTVHVHVGIEDEYIRRETCTTEGEKRQVYPCCGKYVKDEHGDVIITTVPKHAHTLVFHAEESPTCAKKGTQAYYSCEECHQLFSATDITKVINHPEKLNKIEHEFIDDEPGKRHCKICGEVVKYKNNNGANTKVTNNGGVKNDKDEVRKNADSDIKNIESTINVTQKEEASPEILNEYPAIAEGDKLTFEIVIEKTTTYKTDVTKKEIELVPEVDDLVTIEIEIPSGLRGKQSYKVVRSHDEKQANGSYITKYVELTKEPNPETREYIQIRGNKIILHVRKFSEYVVVGFDEEVDLTPDDDESYSNSGSVSSYKVEFKSNGGTEVKSITVKYGDKITAPETTRDGYEFTGWYKDSNLTTLFDFNSIVRGNMVLYAGWKEAGDGWFTDVNRDDWFYDSVKYVYDKGFMNGISGDLFDPYGSMTRAMFVTILYRIENEPGFVPSGFVDLEVESWYEDAVHWAYENGITLGVSDTEFAPHSIIIREQIVAMLYRYALVKGYDVSAGQNTNILSYEDALTISEYAVPSFQWAVGDGIMNGKSETTLNPKDDATRAEASALMMRLYEKFNK